jgi:hypothetical protein
MSEIEKIGGMTDDAYLCYSNSFVRTLTYSTIATIASFSFYSKSKFWPGIVKEDKTSTTATANILTSSFFLPIQLLGAFFIFIS